MKNSLFDNLVKNKALEHEAPVPPGAWANISKEKDRKRPLVIWWTLGLLLVCVCVSTSLVYNGRMESKTKEKQLAIVVQPGNAAELNKNNSNEKSITTQQVDDKNVTIETGDSLTTTLIQNSSDVTAGNTVDIEKEEAVSLSTRNGKIKHKIPADKPGATNAIVKAGNTTTIGNNRSKIRTAAKNKRKQNVPSLSIPTAYNGLEENQDVQTISAINKLKKKTNAATKVKIQAPGIEYETATSIAGSDDGLSDPAVVNSDIEKNIHAGDSTQLVQTTAGNKRSTPVQPVDSVTSILQPQKENNRKRLLYVDISGSAFQPVQQNARLLSINRTNTGPLFLSEYKAANVRTALDPAFGASVALRKSIGKKVYLSAGFQYAVIKEAVRLEGEETNTRYSIVKRLSPSGTSLVDDTVANTSTGTRIISAVNSYRFASIPVLLQYELSAHRSWSLLLAGGFYFNVHSSYQNSIGGKLQPFYAGNVQPGRKQSGFTVDGYAGARLSRSLGTKFQLYAEPGFQFNFMRYKMPGMINFKRIHRAGIHIGFSYALPY